MINSMDFDGAYSLTERDLTINNLVLKLNQEGIGETRRSLTEHVHKNDEGLGLTLRGIQETKVDSNNFRVGLVVGNGSILSALPNIPAEIVILSDYNPFIHEWAQYSLDALSTSASPDEYKAKVYSDANPLYVELKQASFDPDEGLKREVEDLKELHFLSSQQRFDICKEAVKNKKIVMAAVDLRDPNRLKSALETVAAEITFANLTNVWEHAGDLSASLRSLPFNEDAIIIASSRAYTDRFYPRMLGIMRGLSAYIDNVGSAYRFWKYKMDQRR